MTPALVPEQSIDEREPEAAIAAREPFWVTDAQLIRLLAVPDRVAREAIRMLDSDPRSGFPRKEKLWGDRRYWPAVRAYLDGAYGFKLAAPTIRRGPHG